MTWQQQISLTNRRLIIYCQIKRVPTEEVVIQMERKVFESLVVPVGANRVYPLVGSYKPYQTTFIS